MVQNENMSNLSNEKSLKILLDGAPGVGKTTVCQKACKEWALGKAFTDFKLMVYVSLCDDHVSRAHGDRRSLFLWILGFKKTNC